jgi:ABC-type bacteriocin/lantibiotic exporter with double-glycine peptidase domain
MFFFLLSRTIAHVFFFFFLLLLIILSPLLFIYFVTMVFLYSWFKKTIRKIRKLYLKKINNEIKNLLEFILNNVVDKVENCTF